MKSIKKFALIAAAAILSVSFASAQVGIQAGYSWLKETDTSRPLQGFHVGPVYNMAIQGPISIQFGALYGFHSRKEIEVKWGSLLDGKSTTTAHQIDIPVRVAASFPFGSGLSAFVFGGPNFNFGLALTNKTTGTLLGVKDNGTYNLYKNGDISRFNLQLGLGAGLKYNSMGVRFNYDFGLLDMNKRNNNNYRIDGMKIGLFYNF